MGPYRYWDGHVLLLVEGTGHFASNPIRCKDVLRQRAQRERGLLPPTVGGGAGAPQLKTVLPLAAEAITRQDGASKNDCERSAAKRLLVQRRREYPKLKFIVVEDSLASNGPHLERLGALNLRDIIGVKEGDHEALFEAVQERLRAGKTEEFAKKRRGLPLNLQVVGSPQRL